MTKNKFDEICDNYVKSSLLEIIFKKKQWKSYYSEERFGQIKDFAYGEYCRVNKEVHSTFNNPNQRIDRHKVAAAFYISFLQAVKHYPIIESKSEHPSLSVVTDFMYHYIAFRSALSIMMDFIFANQNEIKNDNQDYVDYLSQKGFNPPPKLICENEKMSYFGYAILQILQTSLKMKDGTRLEQSVFLISDIFFHIERNSRDNFNLT
jgi:hypothetical protein